MIRTAVRWLALLMLGGGVGLLGLLAWWMITTADAAHDAQRELRSDWSAQHRLVSRGDDAEPVRLRRGVAKLVFPHRVADQPLVVLRGVTPDVLARAPGTYPGSESPGEQGNFAVAGHRTTYGAPFADIDRLHRGDRIRVTDRAGVKWRYRVVHKRVVDPSLIRAVWNDPLGNGEPTMTLTTCHPRFSARSRLVVHAVLVQ